MERFIYVIRENTDKWLDYKLYVRATEKEIEEREYLGGFCRFIQECYGYSKNYPRGTKCNGQKILSLREFDQWRKEHYCC